MRGGHGHPVAGLAGCLCPGLGLVLRGRVGTAVLAFLGAVVPLFWAAGLLTDWVNDRVRAPHGAAPASVLDGTFLRELLPHLSAVPPEHVALVVLGLAVHVLAAWAAWRD